MCALQKVPEEGRQQELEREDVSRYARLALLVPWVGSPTVGKPRLTFLFLHSSVSQGGKDNSQFLEMSSTLTANSRRQLGTA